MPPTIPFPPGSLVACYLRDSGGDAQDKSIAQQEAEFTRWCNQNALIPGSIFKDIARPGSSVVSRTGFHDMIHHFRTGKAKETGLVIWSYSRFARDFDDAQFYRADLRRRGYIFYSLTDDIPEGSMGRLFEAVIDWKNEQFLEDLSRDAKRGLRDLVTQYGAVPGTPPRGFKREKIIIGKRRDGQDHIAHRWIPDPEVIPQVQRAFAMRAARKPLSEIHTATHLYSSINSYQTFFTNKLYLGILEYGDQVIENYCQPIIDQATWDAVQSIITEYSARLHLKNDRETGNPSHPRRINSRYMLSGLLYCARCGSPLFGASAPQDSNQVYDRYACTRAYRRRDCTLKPIPRKVIETAILDTVKQYILLPEIMHEHQNSLNSDQEAAATRLASQRTEHTTHLAKVRRQTTNITNAISETGHTRSMIEKLTALEAEETTILAQIAELDLIAQSPIPSLTPQEIALTSTNLTHILEINDLPITQTILRGIIQHITVDRQDNRITGIITYYYPPGVTDKPPPEEDTETVTIYHAPVGAQSHRHSFETEFFALMRVYKKKHP